MVRETEDKPGKGCAAKVNEWSAVPKYCGEVDQGKHLHWLPVTCMVLPRSILLESIVAHGRFRGNFFFIYNVARNTGELPQPDKEYV